MSEYVVDVNRIAMRGWISVLGMLTGLIYVSVLDDVSECVVDVNMIDMG